MRLGLLVNPLAGAGGPLAMHGSDGYVPDGTVPEWASRRASEALGVMLAHEALREAAWLAGAGALGEHVLRSRGQDCETVGPCAWPSDASHTKAVASRMLDAGLDLLLFAGGDGTARDLLDVVGRRLPVLGIPAGVKLQSGCFAVSPRAAGRLAARFLESGARRCELREVVDLDEAGLHRGVVAARLYGEVDSPVDPTLLQSRKSRAAPDDAQAAAAIAAAVLPQLRTGLHIIGPGSTTWALKKALRLDGSLIGVDVVRDGVLRVRDATEAQLWALVDDQPGARLWLTAIGGQGHVLGRGNAPLSARVLQALAPAALTLLVTPRKLQQLPALLVDCGDAAVDERYCGHVRVVTGPRDEARVRLTTL